MNRSSEIDAFLADLPEDLGAALETLREQIAAAAPDAVETIAYGVPAFRYRGRPLISFSAGRQGTGPCALYVQSLAAMNTLRELLEPYRVGKGTIHFTPEAPLPAELVTELVRARMVETDRKGRP